LVDLLAGLINMYDVFPKHDTESAILRQENSFRYFDFSHIQTKEGNNSWKSCKIVWKTINVFATFLSLNAVVFGDFPYCVIQINDSCVIVFHDKKKQPPPFHRSFVAYNILCVQAACRFAFRHAVMNIIIFFRILQLCQIKILLTNRHCASINMHISHDAN